MDPNAQQGGKEDYLDKGEWLFFSPYATTRPAIALSTSISNPYHSTIPLRRCYLDLNQLPILFPLLNEHLSSLQATTASVSFHQQRPNTHPTSEYLLTDYTLPRPRRRREEIRSRQGRPREAAWHEREDHR